jgi:hypothetical protein
MSGELLGGLVGVFVLLTFAYGFGERAGAEGVHRNRCPGCGHPGHTPGSCAYTVICEHHPTHWDAGWIRHACRCGSPSSTRP